jgi:hypothetical protein
LTATAGGGLSAATGDIGNLFAALAVAGAGRDVVIIAAAPEAAKLKTQTGANFDYDILPSTALAAKTVAAIEVSSLVVGFASTADFSVSKAGLLHMEDTSPTDLGTPSKSLYQIDGLAVRMTCDASWAMRAPGHAQFITNVSW